MFALLKQSVRPEFLNRIDEVIMFRPLSKQDIRQITELQLNGVIAQLKDTNDITLDITDWVADGGRVPPGVRGTSAEASDSEAGAE